MVFNLRCIIQLKFELFTKKSWQSAENAIIDYVGNLFLLKMIKRNVNAKSFGGRDKSRLSSYRVKL